MWLTSVPEFGRRSATPAESSTGGASPAGTPQMASRREISLVIKGLRSVARHCAVSARATRYEVLICHRARAVHADLLRVAALVDIAAKPDRDTILTLRWLLTDGCTSPLYNPAIPAERLHQVLEDAATALAADDDDRLSVSSYDAAELEARGLWLGTRRSKRSGRARPIRP